MDAFDDQQIYRLLYYEEKRFEDPDKGKPQPKQKPEGSQGKIAHVMEMIERGEI